MLSLWLVENKPKGEKSRSLETNLEICHNPGKNDSTLNKHDSSGSGEKPLKTTL